MRTAACCALLRETARAEASACPRRVPSSSANYSQCGCAREQRLQDAVQRFAAIVERAEDDFAVRRRRSRAAERRRRCPSANSVPDIRSQRKDRCRAACRACAAERSGRADKGLWNGALDENSAGRHIAFGAHSNHGGVDAYKNITGGFGSGLIRERGYSNPHFSSGFLGNDVAHALLRAASPLLATLGIRRSVAARRSVENRLATARVGACATSPGGLVEGRRNYSGTEQSGLLPFNPATGADAQRFVRRKFAISRWRYSRSARSYRSW